MILLISEKAFSDKIIVHKIYSDNNEYRAEIIDYSRNFWDNYGQTKVFDIMNNHLLYKIDRTFNQFGTFVSNNGSAILAIDYNCDSIFHFINGKAHKSYSFKELLHCDYEIEDCDLKYENPDLRIVRNTNLYNSLSQRDKIFHGVLDSSIKGHLVYQYKKKSRFKSCYC